MAREEKKILFIGGSPCSGKSTVAERMEKEFGMKYFKADDYLDDFMNRAAKRKLPVCKAAMAMKADEIWMRDPQEQCDEEFAIYREIAGYTFEELNRIKAPLIIAEGAGFTPEVMKKYKTDKYVCIIPTPDFQISHYRQRSWVPYVLDGCTDQDKAFDNWMQRDILYAAKIREECAEQGIPCLVNDGSYSEDSMFRQVAELLGFIKEEDGQ